MLNRSFVFLGGFFVYVTNLLCYVRVPADMSKLALAGGFGAVAAVCTLIALALKGFSGWRRTLSAILIGASVVSVVAVASIALLRESDSLKQAMSAGQLDGFSDYRTGGTVTPIVLAAGAALALFSPRKTKP